MNWHPDLYVGDRISGRKDDVCSQIRAGKWPSGVWVILPASNGRDQLDIRPAKDLGSDWFRDHEAYIVGLAADRKEAVGLVVSIAEECFARNGDADIRSFLFQKG